jgi:uncharacterized protein YjbJ (UPF0337 family)
MDRITGSGACVPARRVLAGTTTREEQMGFMDKLRNRFQMARGHGKQKAGQAMGDQYLEAEGRGERVEGGARQVGEQVKDAGKSVRDSFRD